MIIYGGGKSGRIHRNVQPLVKVEKAEGEKKCNVCKRLLPLASFYKTARTKDGRHTICSECQRKREREARARRTGIPEGYKKCAKCGEVLPKDSFSPRACRCKACSAADQRERRAKKKAEDEKERDTCGTCDGFTPATSDEKYGACTKRLTDKQAHPMKDRRQAACGYYERKKGNNG